MRIAETSALVVLDCDPLKGLWYNWIHAADGWPGVDVVEREYARLIREGRLGFPFYVYLDATETQLRQRRADDATRRRRGFEKNVKAVGPQRRYFAALEVLDPGRVAFIDTSDRESVVEQAIAAVRAHGAMARDPLAVLASIARWIREHPPLARAASSDAGDGLPKADEEGMKNC